MLEILTAPHPALSSKAKEVEKVDHEIVTLLKDMEESLNSAKDPIGVGLAAPQVGKSLRIFIARTAPKSRLNVFINPEVVRMESDPSKKRPKKK